MTDAVDPLWIVTAGVALAPSAARGALLAGASKFMCCEPVARAMVSFVQLRNSKLTCASRDSRVCSSGEAGIPVKIGPLLLADLRVKFSIHPISIHGEGGASRLNEPNCDGSKSTGACVTRLTGAK